MIVSLAHAAGATVWGQTGTGRKTAAIIEQGADRAIVASPDELGEQITQFEPTVVFDPLGVTSWLRLSPRPRYGAGSSRSAPPPERKSPSTCSSYIGR